MSKHTPGPWEVCRDSRGCQSVRAKSGFLAFTPSIQHYNDPTRYIDETEEAKANAHLIAAAPDMLEALKDVIQIVRVDEWPRLSGKCRAAIAKAEGVNE